MSKTSDDARVFTSAAISSEELLQRARRRLRSAEAVVRIGGSADRRRDRPGTRRRVCSTAGTAWRTTPACRCAGPRRASTSPPRSGRQRTSRWTRSCPRTPAWRSCAARLCVNDCPATPFASVRGGIICWWPFRPACRVRRTFRSMPKAPGARSSAASTRTDASCPSACAAWRWCGSTCRALSAAGAPAASRAGPGAARAWQRSRACQAASSWSAGVGWRVFRSSSSASRERSRGSLFSHRTSSDLHARLSSLEARVQHLESVVHAARATARIASDADRTGTARAACRRRRRRRRTAREAMRRAVHQFVPGLARRDGVGDEVLAWRTIFREAGYESDIVAGVVSAEDRRDGVVRLEDYRSDDRALLIYHHAIGNDFVGLVSRLPGRDDPPLSQPDAATVLLRQPDHAAPDAGGAAAGAVSARRRGGGTVRVDVQRRRTAGGGICRAGHRPVRVLTLPPAPSGGDAAGAGRAGAARPLGRARRRQQASRSRAARVRVFRPALRPDRAAGARRRHVRRLRMGNPIGGAHPALARARSHRMPGRRHRRRAGRDIIDARASTCR